MAARNLLVLVLPDASEAAMRGAIAARANGEPAVHVVAPTRVGPLEWLATDEDEARSEAEIRALEAEWTLADQADVAGEAGDVDPVLAVDDALRSFPADEILIVGGASENGLLEASLRRFGLPVTRVGGSLPPPEHQQLREEARAIVGGRSKATPFVFFAAVNLTLLALAALITAIVLLVLWLH
jgi:hypothetical protein